MSPPKRQQRRHDLAPKLHKPAGYLNNPALAPKDIAHGTEVHGMPQVHWPCDNVKEQRFHGDPPQEQMPPTPSNLIPQRKQTAGTCE